MNKVVLKLEFVDEKIRQKALKKVSGISGVESIALDSKDKKLTVTGHVDPVALVAKLRKICHTEIESVGPAKEPEKKIEESKKVEGKKAEAKKDDKKKDDPKGDPALLLEAYPAIYQHPYYYLCYQYQPPAGPPPPPPPYHYTIVEDYPIGCVIC